MNPLSIAFHHLGCKVNFAEASSLARQFRQSGYAIRDFHEKADLYVISTCVVTAVAEKKCRAAIRQAHTLNPEARIAVIGCLPEINPEEIAGMEGVSIILGHTAKFNLFEEVEKLVHSSSGHDPYHHFDKNDFVGSWSIGDRTRSFLKVQDGCDYYCSYCTIPLARGHSRSDTIDNVVRNAKEIASLGIHEIVLTGVNIGDFGRQNGESFAELVAALDGIDDLPRIRISSIEPDLLTDPIIERVAASRHFMPHFHIPLQSGTDKVLKEMKRKYGTGLYRSRIEKIRSLLPLACIAADVITGFPGETEEDFRDTAGFLRSLDLSYMHVFPYSRRDNTLASKMGDFVNDKVKKERSEILHQLSDEKKLDFYRKNKGKRARVLFESDNTNGFIHGFTENYIKVKVKFDPALVNTVREVKLETIDSDMTYLTSSHPLDRVES